MLNRFKWFGKNLLHILVFFLLMLIIQLPIFTELGKDYLPFPNDWWRIAYLIITVGLSFSVTYLYLRKVSSLNYLRVDGIKNGDGKFILAALILDSAFLVAMLVWVYIASGGRLSTSHELLSNPSLFPVRFLLYLVLTCLTQPFLEELLFRVCLMGGLKKVSPYLALIASTLLFTFAHGVEFALPHLFSGLIYSFIFLKTERLWPSFVCHAFHNTILVLGILLF